MPATANIPLIDEAWLLAIGCRTYNYRVFAYAIDLEHGIYFARDRDRPDLWGVEVVYCGECLPIKRRLWHRGHVWTLIPALGGRLHHLVEV